MNDPVGLPATVRKRPGKAIRADIAAPAPESSPALPLAVWSDLPTFAGSIEHWLQQDAFNEWQINHLLDPRAAVAMRAKLAMLWAFSDERQSFECDLEATRRAVCEFLRRKLRAVEARMQGSAEAMRKIVEGVRSHG